MMTAYGRNDVSGAASLPRREILVIDGGRLVGEPPSPDELPRRTSTVIGRDTDTATVGRDDVPARDFRSRRADRRTWC